MPSEEHEKGSVARGSQTESSPGSETGKASGAFNYESSTGAKAVGGAIERAEYETSPIQNVDPKLEKSLKLKMDLQLVPLSLMLYFLSFLDRTNIGQARLNGLQEELKLTGHDYRIALTVLYVPYIIFEIPSNLLIKKVGPARWIPGLVTVWGIVSTLQGIVTTKTGLYIVRAFLGFAEAGILPGIALYLTFFYKPHEIHLRQALYFSGSSLSGAFSGLLSTAIGKMDGLAGLRGWSWIFILEGIFTVLFGVLCLWILPNGPNKLWWVTPAERQLATSRMETTTFDSTSKAAGSGMGSEAKTEDAAAITTKDKHDLTDRQFVFKELLRTFTDPLVLLFCASGYTYATGLYSLAFFSPSIIKSLDNYTAVQAQLLSAPPNAVAFVVSVAVAVASDRFKWRYPAAMFCIILAIIGFAVTYASMTPSVRYGGIIILSSGIYSIPPVGISWMLNNTASHYKRACSIALYIVFTNSGGITSNWLFNDNEAPRYKRGFLVNLALCSLSAVIVTLAELYIMWEKKQRKLGKRDWRVNELRAKGWDEEKIRVYLGDRHPNYELTL